MRFIILLLARWTCPKNKPDLSDTLRKCRIGTAKFFTLLLLLYHTSAKAGETSTAAFNNYKAGGGGHGHYHPSATPVPVMVIPPKTGDMTLLQYIARLLGLVR